MGYWLDLFTGTTWKEFRDAGARVSGFSAARRNVSQRVKQGDVLLCYLTGVMRWVGALEVGEVSTDTTRIWKDQEFPVRFNVKPLIMLEPEHGVRWSIWKGVSASLRARRTKESSGLCSWQPQSVQKLQGCCTRSFSSPRCRTELGFSCYRPEETCEETALQSRTEAGCRKARDSRQRSRARGSDSGTA
jgi:hypothetical protein